MAGSVGNAVAQREEARKPEAMMRQAIERQKPEFAKGLPAHVDVDRFVRGAQNALYATPKLVECTLDSVIISLQQAAQLGLEVNDARGQAFLIPRWDSRANCNKASLQLGWRGLVDLAARSGIIVDVDDIREHDVFDIRRGTEPCLYHAPKLGRRGVALGYYAVAHFADGRSAFEVMSVEEVEEHRDKFASSRTKKPPQFGAYVKVGDEYIYGPWVEHFDAMSRKSVIRKLLGRLPQAVEFARADAIEAESYEQHTIEGPRTPQTALAAVPPPDVDVETGEVQRSPQADNPEIVETTAAPDRADLVDAFEMLAEMARSHGVSGDDALAAMCSQIVGKEVVNWRKDVKGKDWNNVLAVLRGLAEGEDFPLNPQPQPVREPGEYLTGDDWREQAHRRGVSVSDCLKQAQEIGRTRTPVVRLAALDEIAGTGIGDELYAWLLTRSKS